MPLPSSGAISLSQVNTELGRPSTQAISMNDAGLRTLFGVASGAISMSQGYGKSSVLSQGLWVGGVSSSSGLVFNTIDRMVYSTETTAALAVTLSVARSNICSVTQKIRAYFIGGTSGAFVFTTHISGYNFDSGTARAVAAVTDGADNSFNGGLSSNTTGYRVHFNVSIAKFVFATETFTASVGAVQNTKTMAAIFSVISRARGYLVAGVTPGTKGQNNASAVIDSLSFTTETGVIVAASAVVAGMRQLSANAGSIGFSSASNSLGGAIEGFTFSTEASANTAFTVGSGNVTNRAGMSTHYNTTKAYQGGGAVDSSVISHFTFSNGTNGAISAALSSARASVSATQSNHV